MFWNYLKSALRNLRKHKLFAVINIAGLDVGISVMGSTYSTVGPIIDVESLTFATIAMIIAVAVLKVIIPLFNNMTNKVLAFDFLQTFPWLLATTAVVGLIAGAYPAWLPAR
jgi:putative ABC transport system permease protein